MLPKDMPKKTAKKETPVKTSPKVVKDVVEKVAKVPVEKIQEEIMPKAESVTVAPPPQSAVVEPPKQKIVVEEKDAPVTTAENVTSGKVEAAKVEPTPVDESSAASEAEKIIEPSQVSAQEIPTVDKNAPLAIEKATGVDSSETSEEHIKRVVEQEEDVPIEKSGKKLFVFGGIVLVFLILGVLGLFFIFVNNQPSEKKAAVTQEAVKTTPTPEAVNRSEWSFEVLNGSGVAGSAKKAADKLEALGYHVINTDNADTSDYTENKLYVTADMASKEDLLVADLKADFNIASVSGVLKDSTASARLIVGK